MGIWHPKRAQKLLKNASTIETLKTRVRPRFACQKIECSRERVLEMAQKCLQIGIQTQTRSQYGEYFGNQHSLVSVINNGVQ